MRWTRSDRAIGSAVLAFCALFLVVGCDKHAQTPETPVQHKVCVSFSPTPNLAIGLHTIAHDGHWFVLASGYEAVALLHHPACPCREKE